MTRHRGTAPTEHVIRLVTSLDDAAEGTEGGDPAVSRALGTPWPSEVGWEPELPGQPRCCG